MGSYGYLKVGSLVVGHFKNGMPAELLAVFRDDMLNRQRVLTTDYYSDRDEDEDEYVEVAEFRAPGRVIADRLDIMGFEARIALDFLDDVLEGHRRIADGISFVDESDTQFEHARQNHAMRRAALAALNANFWVEQLAAALPGDLSDYEERNVVGSRSWLIDLLEREDEDGRRTLRLALLATPDAEVRLEVTDLVHGGWLSGSTVELASGAMDDMRAVASSHAPTVVLTEGRTDAEFLSDALEIRYPHLTDLIRFLDFDQKAEGGAGALVRLVRAFAAAGIANKVVAIFDNDAAAADALTILDSNSLPSNIRVLRFPPIELASNYPTLGPPTVEAPNGSLANADVNGLAGSIELYLGRDVLALPGGQLRPVRWSSLHRTGYQGVVTEKGKVHELFRKKASAALRDRSLVANQDWNDLDTILQGILRAFRAA
jgi:hypothetical protein